MGVFFFFFFFFLGGGGAGGGGIYDECQNRLCWLLLYGPGARKTVFGVSNEVRFKPACSAA